MFVKYFYLTMIFYQKKIIPLRFDLKKLIQYEIFGSIFYSIKGDEFGDA
jgi:hypothetical protein